MAQAKTKTVTLNCKHHRNMMPLAPCTVHRCGIGANDRASCVLQLEAEPKEPSFLQLAKGLVGKDFTQPISLPVELNEPMSDMMKRAEEIEYSELLDAVSSFMRASMSRLHFCWHYHLRRLRTRRDQGCCEMPISKIS